MNQTVQAQLREVVTRYGTSVCDDPQRLRALLADLCPQHKRETLVLAQALEHGVARELLSSSDAVPWEALHGRLARTLRDDLAMEEAAARWAVESWAQALGKVRVTPLATWIDAPTATLGQGAGPGSQVPTALPAKRKARRGCMASLALLLLGILVGAGGFYLGDLIVSWFWPDTRFGWAQAEEILEPRTELELGEDPAYHRALSADGKTLAALFSPEPTRPRKKIIDMNGKEKDDGLPYGHLSLWDLTARSPHPRWQVPIARPHDYHWLVLSPDGRWLGLEHNHDQSGSGATTHVYDGSTGQKVCSVAGKLHWFSPNGRWVATEITVRHEKKPEKETEDQKKGYSTVRETRETHVYECATGKKVFFLEGSEPRFGPDLKTLITVAPRPGDQGPNPDNSALFSVWDVSASQVEAGKQPPKRFDLQAPEPGAVFLTYSREFSPDRRLLAIVYRIEHIHHVGVWDLATGQHLWSVAPYEKKRLIGKLTFSPDGTLLLASSHGEESFSYGRLGPLWKARTGEEIKGYPQVAGAYMVAFEPTNRYLLALRPGSALVMDYARAKERFSRIPFEIDQEGCAVTADGRLLLSVDRPAGRIKVWRIRYPGQTP
jgi:hypothetical protein